MKLSFNVRPILRDEGIDGIVDGGIDERVREGMEEVIDGRDDGGSVKG